MIAAFYIAVCILGLYLLVTVFTFSEIPKSISDTNYLWYQLFKGTIGSKLFTLTLTAVTFLILPLWITMTPDTWQWLAFIGCSGLLFVAAACMFKEQPTKGVHFTSAFLWAGATVAWLLIMGMWLPLVISIGLCALLYVIDGTQHLTFWAEFACVLSYISGTVVLL